MKHGRRQQVVEAHEKAARHNRGNNGHKYIAEHLHKALNHVALLLLLFRLLRPCLQVSQLLLHLLAYQVYGPGTKDDLELGLGEKYPFYPLQIADRFLVPQVIVAKLKPQSCGAVGHRLNIFFPAHIPDDLACYFCVIHAFLPLSFWFWNRFRLFILKY